jgi:hypothetical protein
VNARIDRLSVVSLFAIVNLLLSVSLACGTATYYDHELYLTSTLVEEADEIINGVNELPFFLDLDRTPRHNLVIAKVRQLGGIPQFSLPYLDRSPPSPGGCHGPHI